ncbi:MAG: dihydroorotate dehydrogenase-like protein [Betaproteobacteria bacterium]
MDTTCTYLGLRLAHPFMAGASPLGAHLDSVKRLEDGGCAAIVLPSLFEEQITLAASGRIHHVDPLDAEFAALVADFPPPSAYRFGPDEYLEHLRKVKAAVSIPVIASLNGASAETWLEFSTRIEEAGADALELNLYEVVTDLNIPSVAVEEQLRTVVANLKQTLKCPLAVKLSPYFSAVGNLARRLDEAGTDGLVMFNRFYQPDIDIRAMTVAPTLQLSTSAELRLRLRWLAILFGRLRTSLAVTGGVATPTDGIKAVLAGADAVQMVSALLTHGAAYFRPMREALVNWMEWQKMDSLEQVRGRMSLQHAPNPEAFERAHYIRTLQSWKP